MKNLSFYLLIALIISSCSKDQVFSDQNDTKISLRSIKASDILIRDYGYLVGIFHLDSGEYLYCNDCQNNWDQRTDMRLDSATVSYDLDQSKITLYDYGNNKKSEFSFTSSADYQISGIGWSSESLNQSEIGTTAWVFDTADDIFSKAHCQCVHETSTPCTPDYEDADGCQIGGPDSGTEGCSIGSSGGASGGMTILGSGGSAGGSSGSSCGVTCDTDDGFYPCCNEF